MANVPESSAFDAGIYQIETADPVLGGVNGIANAQAKGLANRTKYLYDQQALKAPLASPAFTGTPTAPTASPGSSNQVANMAAVQAAIAALVASSPAALDTLNELAAALGNDANFAATMNTALAAKAPLASPALTGNPTSPTPAPGDNDTSIATTAFVKAALDAIGSLPIYAQSLTGNGYKKFPGGLILQWGTVASAAGGTTHSFTIPFPSASLMVNAIISATSAAYVAATANSPSSFSVYPSSGTPQVMWFAIGY